MQKTSKTINSLHHRRAAFLVLTAFLAIGSLILCCDNSFAAAKPTTPAAAPPSHGMGRLIIKRSAILGPTIVAVEIDGVKQANITYNRNYDAPIAAGPHVLRVYPTVSYEHPKPWDVHFTVEPGKTYTFLAKRKDVRVILE